MKYQLRLNILENLPHNTILYLDDEARQNLFSLLNFSSLSEAASKLDIKLGNLSRYRLGQRGIPLAVFVKLLEKSGLSIETFQSKMRISMGKTANPLRMGPYISINSEWIYIAELIRGDGHIGPNFWYIYFVNKNTGLIRIVKRFFAKLGIEKSNFQLLKVNGVGSLAIRSSLFAHIFSNVFEIPTGRKGEMNLPRFYWNNKEFAAAAIRAAFDAEGTVSIDNPSPRRIVITSISKSWLSDLKELLRLLKIDSEVHREDRPTGNGPIYRLRIYGRINLNNFLNLVRPAHSKRLSKLEKLLKTYDENRVPEGSMKIKILETLQDKGPMKREGIALTLSFKKRLLSWHLSSLQRKNLIEITERIYTNNGSYFKYNITELGLAELSNENGSL